MNVVEFVYALYASFGRLSERLAQPSLVGRLFHAGLSFLLAMLITRVWHCLPIVFEPASDLRDVEIERSVALPWPLLSTVTAI